MKKALEITKETDISTLPGGVRVKFNQISLSILDAINRKFPDPEPPLVEIESKSTPDNPYYESNPNDPDYAVRLRNVAQERGTAMIDAMIIMGVELIDGVPDDENWLRPLSSIRRLLVYRTYPIMILKMKWRKSLSSRNTMPSVEMA